MVNPFAYPSVMIRGGFTVVNRGRMEMTKVLNGTRSKPWTTVGKQRYP
jgi:hypothetical protein